MEVLLRTESAESFADRAKQISQNFTLTRPPCEIVYDSGGAPWCIVEAMGPRALICELMVLAQDMGCERRPFPM